MTFNKFLDLPNELQLSIFNELESSVLNSTLYLNHHCYNLTKDIIISKINKFNKQENSILISLYSPQHRNRQIELYSTINMSKATTIANTPAAKGGNTPKMIGDASQEALVNMDDVNDKLLELSNFNGASIDKSYFATSIDKDSSVFQLDQKRQTRDPLKIGSFTNLTTADNDIPKNNMINLVVNEDEPSIKLYLEIIYNGTEGLKSIYQSSTKLSQLVEIDTKRGMMNLEKGALNVEYKLTKIGETETNYGYGFDCSNEYFLEIGEVSIKNGYLLSMFENV